MKPSGRSLTLVLGLGLPLLPSCARYEAKPLSAAQTARTLETRRLDAPPFRAFLQTNLHRALPAWPLPQWDLESLTLAAFYYQPSLDVARADWRLAVAGQRSAAERPNPTVGASVGRQPVPDASPWIPALVFDLPIETAGKRRLRTDQARHLSEAARLNLAATAWQVRSHLRASVVEDVWDQQRLQLLQRQVELRQDLTERMTAQWQAGAIARTDLTTARIALDRARADLADAQRLAAAARVNVADAIGVPVRALEGVDVAFDLGLVPDAAGLTSTQARGMALQRRPDILGALAEYAASQSALQLEVAKQYPDINLAPGYSWNAGSAGENDWQLSATSILPLFNRNQGPIAEAAGHRDALAARFLALQARVIGDLDRAIATVRASQASARALNAVAARESTHRQEIEAQFKAGAVDQLEVLTASLELSSAELSRLDALAQAQQAYGQLEDAVQSPLGLPEAALEVSSNPILAQRPASAHER